MYDNIIGEVFGAKKNAEHREKKACKEVETKL